ncbi:MAG: response regulator [Deltaproteobacteria bacterium]|nr:response regulator [Deltaproteobacteria bacterium]
MKTLIVEDDFVSRRVIQAILTPCGPCDVAVNGHEALRAFEMARNEGKPYDLICLDIMMPEMDGTETLRRIREMELESGVEGLAGVKVIMTTALSDFESIMTSFRNQCEAYLVKPISRPALLDKVREIGLQI